MLKSINLDEWEVNRSRLDVFGVENDYYNKYNK